MLDKDIAHHWCEELAANLTDFRKKTRLNPAAKLSFISKQYASLFALVRINRGDAILKGVPHRAFLQQQQEQQDLVSTGTEEEQKPE